MKKKKKKIPVMNATVLSRISGKEDNLESDFPPRISRTFSEMVCFLELFQELLGTFLRNFLTICLCLKNFGGFC